jgi:hypothetical protein
MSKAKVKATFRGMNGAAGFLKDQEYDLHLSRDKNGVLCVEVDPEMEQKEIMPGSAWRMSDEDFSSSFEGKVSLDKIPTHTIEETIEEKQSEKTGKVRRKRIQSQSRKQKKSHK